VSAAQLMTIFSRLNMSSGAMLRIAVVCIIACMVHIAAQPDGWKMTDRFYGFRYEIFGNADGQVLDNIQAKATSLGCFGWAQLGKESNIVGEGRCAKGKGKVFQDFLETLPNVSRFEKLVRSNRGSNLSP
jgi:hypothetical protein